VLPDLATWRQHDPLDGLPKVRNQSLEALAEGWFRLQPGTVTREMIEMVEAWSPLGCSLIQVIGNQVYARNKRLRLAYFQGRLADVTFLLKQAALVRRLPDVDMIACMTDAGGQVVVGAPFFEEVPILSAHASPGSIGDVPVPMLARDEYSYFGGSDTERMLGYKASTTVAWDLKERKAFFHGHDWDDCADKGFASAPLLNSSCFRGWMVEQLAQDPAFEVGVSKCGKESCEEGVPEDKFEDFKLLLVIGNRNGWSDRTMRTLFKSSVTVYVDQGTYEWFMPLLVDGVHWIRVEPKPSAVRDRVSWALEHDEEMHSLVASANKIASDLFSVETMSKYMALVADAYAATLSYTPTLVDNMIRC